MSFDRLAPHYRWMEFVLAGRTLQRARTAWLPATGPVQRALLVGEGNGRFLGAALATWSDATFHCLDASPAMLERARRQVPPRDQARVTFEAADLPHWVPPRQRFDLVATHFFLDCFPPVLLREVMELIAAAAAPEARWLVSDFALPESGFARVRARLIHVAMYGFFRLATALPARLLTPPEPRLAELGFARLAGREFEWGLVRSSLWQRARPVPLRGPSPCGTPDAAARSPVRN